MLLPSAAQIRTVSNWTRATSTEMSQDGRQNNRANQSRAKRANHTASHMKAEHSAAPTAYEGANNSDEDVYDKTALAESKQAFQ